MYLFHPSHVWKKFWKKLQVMQIYHLLCGIFVGCVVSPICIGIRKNVPLIHVFYMNNVPQMWIIHAQVHLNQIFALKHITICIWCSSVLSKHQQWNYGQPEQMQTMYRCAILVGCYFYTNIVDCTMAVVVVLSQQKEPIEYDFWMMNNKLTQIPLILSKS